MVDTISPYRSPVRLVLHAAEATSPYSAQAIARARKKMMAEIALGGDEVVIDNIAYSRNDAATLLDDISEEAWRVHGIIYTFPGLLRFLEEQVFEDEELKKADAYLYDQRFIKVVSPFFSYSFNIVSGTFIRDNKFEDLQQLLNYQGYILPEHQHEAFHKIRNYLDELSYTVRNLSWEKFIADESILHFVFTEEWQKSLNALPPLFTTPRDEIVTHLIELVLRFQRKATWYYLHQVLVNLKALDTNEFNRHEIIRIDEVIYANTKLESNRGTRRREGMFANGRFIWWGLWLIFMIVRIVTCNDRSGSMRYKTYSANPPVEEVSSYTDANSDREQQNEKFLLKQLDSLLQAQNHTTTSNSAKTGEPAFWFSDDPRTARTDSLLVTNNTGFDAVYMYFKDVPGHGMSGRLPKFYSALIRNGETQRVYLLANNGRVYFAFGKGWGTLTKTVSIPLPDYESKAGIPKPTAESLPLSQFFRSGHKANKNYLLHPLFVRGPGAASNSKKYRVFNTKQEAGAKKETELLLYTAGDNILLEADGPLWVMQERGPL